MKKLIFLTCLTSALVLGGFTGNEDVYYRYNAARESEETLDVASFLDAIDISMAENETATDTSDFPSSFDLRSYGIISDIKNQGTYGTCWAIAASDSLETQISRNGFETDPDLSEWHLAYFAYNGEKSFLSTAENVFNSGGINTIAAASLSRWKGMVNEEKVPYGSSQTVDSSLEYSSDYKVTDIYNLHSIISNHVKHSNDFLKDLIYSQNAVAATYYSRPEYYNEDTYSHYCPKSDVGIDHAVIILGWDDNYPKENFLSGQQPKNNGAWLAKNSWGEDWGDNGYFWISYEDQSLCEAGCYFCVPGDTYSTNYQYDETGWAVSVSADSYQKKLSGYMANVFTAENDDPITAVSFYTTEDDADYEISVYKNVTVSSRKASPVNGTLASSASGSQKYTGYHTVVLDTPVDVKKGEKFSVSVKLTNHTSPYVIAMEASSATVSAGFFQSRTFLFHNYASQETDTSYISSDGSSWYQTTGKSYSYTYKKYLDLTSTIQNLSSVTLGNVCLKALASPAGTVPVSPVDCEPVSVTEPAVTTTEPVVTTVTEASATTVPAVTTVVSSVSETTVSSSVPETTLPVTAVTSAASSTKKPAVTTTPPVTTTGKEITTLPAVTTAKTVTETAASSVTEPEPPLKDDIYDINRDGKVNSSDLITMIGILQGTETENYSTDLNNDAKTNILDLILLKEHLTGTQFSTK